MIRNYRRGALAVALVLSVAAMARAGTDQAKEDAPDAEQVQRGKQSYAAHCSHCHGFNMVTAGNVTYDLREFPRDQRERFFESVTNGRNNRMPPWGDQISQEDIADIWAYVRTGGKP